MPTPDFVLELRKKIGHDLMWSPGVAGVVINEAGEVLLCRRADNGEWTTITGMLDPGEHPVDGLLREIEEETAVQARVERLIEVSTTDVVTFANGDRSQFLTLAFRCAYVGGQAMVNDDESADVAWFAPEDLPPMRPAHTRRVAVALGKEPLPDYLR